MWRLLLGLTTALLVLRERTTNAHSAGAWDIYVSDSPLRSNPVLLDGEVDVSGDIYVFVSPETDISQVKFFVDTDTTGTPIQTENFAPYDMAGGNSDGSAKPYDSADLSNGSHTVTVLITFDDGHTLEKIASFSVNNAAITYSLLVSTNADRSNPIDLDGATLDDGVAIFTSPDTSDIDNVEFYLNGVLEKTEGRKPYDFQGGSVSSANLWDTNGQSAGSHTVLAVINLDDGSSVNLDATFVIAGIPATMAPTAIPTASPTSSPSSSTAPTESPSTSSQPTETLVCYTTCEPTSPPTEGA